VFNIVVLVNTLSAADVTALKFLWEHALADGGLTQLALETSLVFIEIVPRSLRKWIHNRLWLFSPGP
jgi:hypothetical protein